MKWCNTGLALLLLALVGCGSSHATAPTPSPTSSLKTYANKAYGFSLSYDPHQFSVEVYTSAKSYEGVSFYAYATKSLAGTSHVSDGVRVWAIKPLFPAATYMEAQASSPLYGHLTWTTLDGVRAFRQEAADRVNRGIVMGLAKGDVYYDIEVQCRTKDWPQVGPAMLALIGTLRLAR